jgi:hypothetical protein
VQAIAGLDLRALGKLVSQALAGAGDDRSFGRRIGFTVHLVPLVFADVAQRSRRMAKVRPPKKTPEIHPIFYFRVFIGSRSCVRCFLTMDCPQALSDVLQTPFSERFRFFWY